MHKKNTKRINMIEYIAVLFFILATISFGNEMDKKEADMIEQHISTLTESIKNLDYNQILKLSKLNKVSLIDGINKETIFYGKGKIKTYNSIASLKNNFHLFSPRYILDSLENRKYTIIRETKYWWAEYNVFVKIKSPNTNKNYMLVFFKNNLSVIYNPDAIVPSFNCNTKLTPIEQQICSSPDIADLDRTYALKYKTLKRNLSKQAFNSKKYIFRKRLSARNNCSNNTDVNQCLINWYNENIKRINVEISSTYSLNKVMDTKQINILKSISGLYLMEKEHYINSNEEGEVEPFLKSNIVKIEDNIIQINNNKILMKFYGKGALLEGDCGTIGCDKELLGYSYIYKLESKIQGKNYFLLILPMNGNMRIFLSRNGSSNNINFIASIYSELKLK